MKGYLTIFGNLFATVVFKVVVDFIFSRIIPHLFGVY